MKKFENKTTLIFFEKEKEGTNEKEKVKLKYSDLCKICLNNFPAGETASQMEKSLKILEKLKDTESFIELEDDHYKLLIKYIDAMNWKFRHHDLITFYEDLKKAESF